MRGCEDNGLRAYREKGLDREGCERTSRRLTARLAFIRGGVARPHGRLAYAPFHLYGIISTINSPSPLEGEGAGG